MKKGRILIAALLLLCCGCRRAPAQPPATAAPTQPAIQTQTAAPETAAPTETQPAAPQTEAPVPATATMVSDTQPPSETAAPETGTAVDLSIELPEADGKMQTSSDPENPYIRVVREARGIDASLLAAVYTVPQNGQNYVFEFSGAAREADQIRRVYLIDEGGAIKSVAAADAAERENLSAAENWFCMNVLIRGVVFPAVREEMQAR